jgi:hypothetical protein
MSGGDKRKRITPEEDQGIYINGQVLYPREAIRKVERERDEWKLKFERDLPAPNWVEEFRSGDHYIIPAYKLGRIKERAELHSSLSRPHPLEKKVTELETELFILRNRDKFIQELIVELTQEIEKLQRTIK